MVVPIQFLVVSASSRFVVFLNGLENLVQAVEWFFGRRLDSFSSIES